MALFDTLNRYKNEGIPGLGASADHIVSGLSIPEINELKYLQQNPNAAAASGIRYDQLGRLLMALKEVQTPATPSPGKTNVAQDLVSAALKQVMSPNAAPVAPQGIQGLMAQAPQQQQQQPQMPPDAMDQGLGAIPAGVMGGEEVLSAAGGGIIAFAGDDEENDGSQLVAGLQAARSEPQTAADMRAQLLADITQERAGFKRVTLPEAIKQREEALTAAGITGQPGQQRAEELGKQIAGAPARKDYLNAMGLARFGFDFAARAAEPGATFLGSAAKAAPESLARYNKSIQEFETLNEQRKDALEKINLAQRAERLGLVKDASGVVEKNEDRLIKLNEKLFTLKKDIYKETSTTEREAEKTKAADKRAKLDREARLRAAEISANATISGQVPDVGKLVRSPEFQELAKDQKWSKERQFAEAADILSASRATPEKMGAAREATYREREKQWPKWVIMSPYLSDLRRKADQGDLKAKRLFNAKKEEFIGRPGTSSGSSGRTSGEVDKTNPLLQQ